MSHDRVSRSVLRRGPLRVPSVALLALVLLAAVGAAQGYLLFEFPGSSAGDGFGWPVAGAGDVNADGFADLVVGAKFAPGGPSVVGEAKVLSGATGAVPFTFAGTVAGGYLGWSVAGAGDVNGDGLPDVIVGAPGGPGGTARVISGASGAILHSFVAALTGSDFFGGSVAGPGDVDEDGKTDLLVGASQTASPTLSGMER